MRETLTGPADWQGSVIAVPPMARDEALDLAPAPNRALIRHIETGGISILMCGGNANFYSVSIGEYEAVVDFLAETVAADTWVIPAIGPDFGRMRDQAAILARKRFPTAMLLPTNANVTPDGLDRAIRLTVDRLGFPLVLYARDEHYLDVERIGRLNRDGCLLFVKYAIVRTDPSVDAYLTRLVAEIGTDRIVSGIGERPAVAHFRDFGLRGVTTGSGCVAPARSTAFLAALKARDYAAAERIRDDFLPLETLRDALGHAAVLHEAVTAAGIGDMGPMLPLMHALPSSDRARVGVAARDLAAVEAGMRSAGAPAAIAGGAHLS